MFVTGVVAMSFVVLIRNNDITQGNWIAEAQENANFTSVFDLFSDLIINNRNLYVLVDFADNVQHTHFFGMLTDIASPIPGLNRLLLDNINVPPELISGGALPTYLALGTDSSFGVGTNMVGEAYLAFGLPGVIVFFSLIGFVINISKRAMSYNIYAYVLYFLFASHAVFYPRAPILYQPRNIVWALLIVFGIVLIQKNTEKE
jgi:hypothetical protein